MNRGVVRHARAYIAGIDVFLRAGLRFGQASARGIKLRAISRT
jgi:hypothetical protein